MVNATNVLQDIDLNKGADYLSWLSKTLAGNIVEWLSQRGIEVSVRWASLMILFLSLLLFYIGIKMSKPLVKWALIIIAFLLFGGIILPFW